MIMKWLSIKTARIIALVNLLLSGIIFYPYPSKCYRIINARFEHPHGLVVYGFLSKGPVISMSDIVINYTILIFVSIVFSLAILYCLSRKKILMFILAFLLLLINWLIIIPGDTFVWE